ncbi:MAG: hypothetical protein WCF90_03495 [Methanomicrobiales archaeon]
MFSLLFTGSLADFLGKFCLLGFWISALLQVEIYPKVECKGDDIFTSFSSETDEGEFFIDDTYLCEEFKAVSFRHLVIRNNCITVFVLRTSNAADAKSMVVTEKSPVSPRNIFPISRRSGSSSTYWTVFIAFIQVI